jgi:PH and SEC7 domain-containing protein
VADSLRAAKHQQDLTSEHSLSRWASSQSLLPREDGGAPADADALGQERARQCWIEDEEFLPKDKIAEWLGGHGAVNAVALRHYVDRFDFQGLRLDYAFRWAVLQEAWSLRADDLPAVCAPSYT